MHRACQPLLWLLLTLLVPRAVGGTYIDSNLAVSSAAHADGGGCYPVPLPG